MALVLKINGVDKSSSVSWPTLSKVEVLTKEVDRLEFEVIKATGKTIPAVNDDIVLEENSVKIFGGVVTERLEQIKGGILIGYLIRCKDYSHYLDRRLVIKNYSNQAAHLSVIDIIETFTTGFTTTNVETSSPTVKSFSFNYEQVTRALTKIADTIGFDWYVDYNKDVHFFNAENIDAPFSLSDTNDKFEWDTLEINQTILQVKNTVYVRGGDYKKTFLEAAAVDVYTATAGQKTFQLAYKYDNFTVKVNGVVQVFGTDQQDDPLTVDGLYNFAEKFITFTTPMVGGEEVIVYGDAYIPIIAQARDQSSIAAYGVYETVFVDKNIKSVEEAQLRAKNELKKYSETVYEGSFKTTQTGLRVGQRIRIQSTIRSLDKTFKINRIVGKARSHGSMEYTVYLIASGQVTLTDVLIELLERDKQGIQVGAFEVLQRLERFVETLAIVDSAPVASATTPPYYYATAGSNEAKYNLATWQ